MSAADEAHAPLSARLPAALVEVAVTLVMALLLPLSPLAASLIARDSRYARRYLSTVVRSARHLRGQVRARAVYRMLVRRLAPQAHLREETVGGCTHCGRCCLHSGCVFLDFDAAGRSQCRIYGSAFWQGLSCGAYPENAMDIEVYRCPSFSAKHRVVLLRSRS